MRKTAIFVAALLLVSCCLAAVAGAVLYFLYVPTTAAEPVVLIQSPGHGEQLRVGEVVTIEVLARDETGVVHLELWVDGDLMESERSILPGGTTPFPLVAVWQPLTPGAHLLTARAFNAQGVRAHSSVNLETLYLADLDDDDVPDTEDLCAGEPGPAWASGCPDRDNDGLPDAEDACPDEAGLVEGEGCPVPSEGDGDGDGLLDWADVCASEPGPLPMEGCPDADGDRIGDAEDACPDQPGWEQNDGCPVEGDLDLDGVVDGVDQCPEEWGSPEHWGCTDGDGDGVRDAEDACPDDAGLRELGGCADRDSDGVPDDDDLRPDESGRLEDHGAPDTGAPDSDGDGISDDIDECDHEQGRYEHYGCPPPGEAEDADGDGLADDEELPGIDEGPLGLAVSVLMGVQERFGFGEGDHPIPIARVGLQLEFLALRVSGDYEEIWCYTYEGAPPRPGEPETPLDLYGPIGRLEGGEWDIQQRLGGWDSLRFDWDSEWRLPMHVECMGYVGLDPPINLGQIYDRPGSEGHGEEEWNVEITRRSLGGDGGSWFEVTYRICEPWCPAEEGDTSFLPLPPHVTVTEAESGVWVIWAWDGDPATIEGFNLYVDGSLYGREEPASYGMTGPFLPPSCGARTEFHMTTYDPQWESNPSNRGVARGPACSRTVRITFDELHTYRLPADEQGAHRPGPIKGEFFVSVGSSVDALVFNSCDCPSWCGECRGFKLDERVEYSIQDIFDYIGNQMVNRMSGWNPTIQLSRLLPYSTLEAPLGPPSVTVVLGPYDDLTVGGRIEDCDCANEDDTILDESHTFGEIRNQRFMFRDEDLVVIGHMEVLEDR